MSLFQCEVCGCRENTATCNYWINKGKRICSVCDPEIGKWHNRFERVMLPKGMFETNKVGNLAHKETGETDVMKYAIKEAL